MVIITKEKGKGIESVRVECAVSDMLVYSRKEMKATVAGEEREREKLWCKMKLFKLARGGACKSL